MHDLSTDDLIPLRIAHLVRGYLLINFFSAFIRFNFPPHNSAVDPGVFHRHQRLTCLQFSRNGTNRKTMGSLWRSETMSLVLITMQKEAAYDTTSALGKLGYVQFRDVCTVEKIFIFNF
jgi:hypothetical protein